MSVKPGDTVEGRYLIIREIDHGGMGTVFLAEHHLIKRRVALKLLRADLAEEVGALERFMNEARVAGTLGHPNIVESTDMGFTRDGVPYIVFELLEGTLLTDEIYRTKGFPIRRALRIGRQIASALAAAHAAGVIHRDLKSDNIFLTDRDDAADHVKVIDFGVSQLAGTEDDAQKSMVVGTPQFMAPEQITAPDTVDARVDIYALGVIMYEMLAARRPFPDDDDPNVVFERILRDALAPLDVPGLPPGFEVLLRERFMHKDASHRFSTMRDAEGAFAAFAGIVRPDGVDTAPFLKALPNPLAPLQDPAHVIALPPVQPRGAKTGWLLGAIVLAAAGGALVLAAPSPDAQAADPVIVRDDAAKITAAIDSTTKAAQLRVDGLAQTPMLRAAIETDKKTVEDMLRSEFALKLPAGEAFELSQLRDGKRVVLAHMPPGDPLRVRDSLGPSLHVVGGHLAVVLASPMRGPDGKDVGAVALSVPVDLAPVAALIAGHARDASVAGLDGPLELVPSALPGTKVDARLELAPELAGSAVLSETIPTAPASAGASVFRLGAFAAWGVAGIFGVLYLASLLRGQRRV